MEPTEVFFGKSMSIFVGPNGGGKSTLLDALSGIIRTKLLGSYTAQNINNEQTRNGFSLTPDGGFHGHILEPHFEAPPGFPPIIEIDLELTNADVENMNLMKVDAEELAARGRPRIFGYAFDFCASWDSSKYKAGDKLNLKFVNHQLQPLPPGNEHLLQYLNHYENNSRIRQELGMSALNIPMMYFASNRSNSSFGTNLNVSTYDYFQSLKPLEQANSRTQGSFADMGIQRIAMTYHSTVISDGKNNAKANFESTENIKLFSHNLEQLGYGWELNPISYERGLYEFVLKKHGKPLAIQHTSSGEKQLLNFLISICGMNVRNALVLIDEPELHLHPLWQKSLFRLFDKLAQQTQNQFVFATHSPVFISPESIEHVTRVYVKDRKSYVKKLSPEQLPSTASQVRIINSQNNEKIFFADAVILVEGQSDRIFWEKIYASFYEKTSVSKEIQFVDVGGKSELKKYAAILEAYEIQYAVIADLDYIEQIGTTDIKRLFKVDQKKIIEDVISNNKSVDGVALSEAIDTALSNGNLEPLKSIWPRIEARYKRSTTKLDSEKNKPLAAFLTLLKTQNIFLLPKGVLEDYLPAVYSRKDIGTLIDFTQANSFESLMGMKELNLTKSFLGEVIAALSVEIRLTSPASQGP